MEDLQPITALILVANALITYQGFKQPALFQRYLFSPEAILAGKDYKRLITSGFLHVDWTHFGFNMVGLYLFGMHLEAFLPPGQYLLIYFGSLLGGSLISLYFHRFKVNYTAVGASGAISGLVFAFIAVDPGARLGMLFLPGLSLPGWLFGALYLAYTFRSIRRQVDNIGHEAHFGGSLIGILLMVAIMPTDMVRENLAVILLLILPSLGFLGVALWRPHWLYMEQPFNPKARASRNLTIEDRDNARKKDHETKMNEVLDKINQHGMESLTQRDKDILSGKLNE